MIISFSKGVRLTEAKLSPCAVHSLCYSPSGNHILTGSADSSVNVLEGKQGTLVCSLIGHSGPVLCVTAGKKYTATCGEDYTCCVYDEITKLKSVKQ